MEYTMLSDANDTKSNMVSNKEIKLIDYSKYLYSAVNNRMHAERVKHEEDILDYKELVKYGEILSK
jgi:hypothetical protein